MKYLSNKNGFLGVDNKFKIKESEFHTFSMPLIVDIKTGENWGELK